MIKGRPGPLVIVVFPSHWSFKTCKGAEGRLILVHVILRYAPPSLEKTQRIVRKKEMFYLMMHSTHFIYGYMASDIWLRTILIVRKETRCRHIGYSYRLTARVLLYAPSHTTDRIAHTTAFDTPVMEHWLEREIAQWVHPMKDRSDDPPHHERTLYL